MERGTEHTGWEERKKKSFLTDDLIVYVKNLKEIAKKTTKQTKKPTSNQQV
jgi:hypothetical protein